MTSNRPEGATSIEYHLCEGKATDMTLTPKERVQRALQRASVDHLPTQINYTQVMGERLAAHLNVSPGDLPERLGNHFVRVELTYPRRLSDDRKVVYDWWGVGWSTETEGYWPVVAPLSQSQTLDDFRWPDPHAAHLLEDAERIIAGDGSRHFIAPNFGFCLFERAWSLRGFEAFNMDLARHQDDAADLLERITEIQVALARRFVTLGVDGGYFGDDYGAQKGMLFSPRTWRKLFKPRLARIFAVFREVGLPVILHSDGDIAPILPDLIEIGLTTLNPVQPEVLDLDWLKRDFGERLAFYGGVSTQTVLPFGTLADVRAAVETCVRVLAADGTGLLIAPSHRMTSDIPLQNVDALLEAFTTVRGGS
jgi:uroporphyrinogen decarboxylase